jgi:antitoxin component of RelBE/YafQ-DinJ toxin-antitoxin module
MATLLTFRLDRTMRERVRARLMRDGTTLSEVVTRGLHEYVLSARAPDSSPLAALPEQVAALLRDLRSAGRSEALSGALADLHSRGWPLPQLARALGVSKQAVQARITRARTVGWLGAADALLTRFPAEPALPAPRRRPRPDGARPHLTIRIDAALRAAAHRAAASEGRSVSSVVESILERYCDRRREDGGQASRLRAR